MNAHSFGFEGNFVLLLHEVAKLSTAYKKRLIFRVKPLNIKSGNGQKLF